MQLPRVMNAPAVHAGVFMLCWGLFKKQFVADNLAPIVDQAFAAGAQPSGPQTPLSTYRTSAPIPTSFAGSAGSSASS